MRGLNDCYKALGLDPGCNEDDIRRAYKALVLKLHPDRGEGSDAARFREVQEAYEHLLDPKKRAALRQEEYMRKSSHRNVRQEAQAEAIEEWLSDDQVEDLTWDLFGWQWPRYRASRGTVEIILTPEEARRGGRIPLRVPVEYPCRECGGRGSYLIFICPGCAGSGKQQYSRIINLNVPPNLAGSSGREMILDGGLRIVLRIGS
ncbi:MAG TPA: DnaJ domain-containing protein [bacterium]|jgi:DnaJ-class molecular chaperone